MAVLSEAPLRLGPLAARLKRDRATVMRWITRGCRTPDGGRVRLEARRVGTLWETTEGSLARFLAAMNPDAPPTPAAAPRTPTERARAVLSANRELERMGVNLGTTVGQGGSS